jgi:hypothetical protein
LAGYGTDWAATRVSYSTGNIFVPAPPTGGDTYDITVTAMLYKSKQAFPVNGWKKSVTVKP